MDLARFETEAVAAQLPPQILAYLRGETRGLNELESEFFFAVGTSLYQQERYARAADIFRALVLGRPESARAWSSLAMCHDAVEDFERAAALYDLAVRAPGDDAHRPRAQLYYARALFWLERFDEANEQLHAVGDREIDDDLDPIRSELRRELAAIPRRRR